MQLLFKILLPLPAIFALYYLLMQIEPVTAEDIVLTREQLPLASEVYDRHGNKIGEFAQEKRYFVPLQEMPRYLIEAFLSAEDKEFFAHRGIDYGAALRALWTNIAAQRIKQGGSTITQQLARLLFLNRQKTWLRKSREAQIAALLEKKYPKTKILEYYLNSVYLGNGAYGVEAASRIYLRKSSRHLDLSEAALLAALPKAPSALAPHRNYPAAAERRRLILQRMVEDKIISPQQYTAVENKVVKIYPHAPRFNHQAPYFNAEVGKLLRRRFSLHALNHGGYQIYTTLDSKLQQRSNARFHRHVAGLQQQHGNELQAAFFALHAQHGDVLAVQGGSDYRSTQFNRTRQTRRRSQQLLLPFILAELSRTHRPNYQLNDIDPAWRTIYRQLVQHQPIDISTLLMQAGTGSLHKMLAPFAIKLDPAIPAIDFTLEQLTTAFAAFANHGYQLTPRYILKIDTSNGKNIFAASPARGKRIFSADVAFIVGEVLRAFSQHNGSNLRGYTASNAMQHDAWALGYNSHISAGVWLGAEHGRIRLTASQQHARMLFSTLFHELTPDIVPHRSKSIAFVSLKIRDQQQQERYVSLPVPL